MADHKDFARAAALESAPRDGVGAFIDSIDEGESVQTYRFESKLKGYRDWRWNVVVYSPIDSDPTISEVVLMPGDNSLIAPDWVPWSERLADYRALQAELEAQAALEAEDETDDLDDDSEDESDTAEADDDREIEEVDVQVSGSDFGASGEPENAKESTLSDSDQANQTEADANSAGKRPKRLFGWRKPRVAKKNKK